MPALLWQGGRGHNKNRAAVLLLLWQCFRFILPTIMLRFPTNANWKKTGCVAVCPLAFLAFLSDCLLRLWWLRVVDFRLTVQRIWYWLIYILDLRFVLVYNCGLILRNKRICYVMLCFLQLCANRVVSLLCPCARFYCAVGERRRERYEITVDMDHVPPH